MFDLPKIEVSKYQLISNDSFCLKRATSLLIIVSFDSTFFNSYFFYKSNNTFHKIGEVKITKKYIAINTLIIKQIKI